MMKLTELEKEVMNMIPNDDFYEEGFESTLWNDVFLGNLKMNTKIARGVLSSLDKKKMIDVEPGKDGCLSLLPNGIEYLLSVGKVNSDGYKI